MVANMASPLRKAWFFVNNMNTILIFFPYSWINWGYLLNKLKIKQNRIPSLWQTRMPLFLFTWEFTVIFKQSKIRRKICQQTWPEQQLLKLTSYPRVPQQAGRKPDLETILPPQHISKFASYLCVPQQAGRKPNLKTILPPQHILKFASCPCVPQQAGREPNLGTILPPQHISRFALYLRWPQGYELRRARIFDVLPHKKISNEDFP